MTVRGIDVASYQSSTPSLAGYGFAFVKATEGTTYTNPRHVAQVAAGRAHGLVVGHYHFLHGGNVAAQAAYFLKTAGWQTGDLLVCDWETPPKGSTAATNAEKGQFLAAVKKARPTARVLLYCNRDYWLTRDQGSVCGDGLWIADPEPAGRPPRIQHPWKFHQYGITAGTDQNVGNFADLAALKTWAGVPAPKPPTPPVPTIDQRVTKLETRVTALEKKG